MTNRKIEYWVIPPEADAEFVAHMEEVLETYEKPYDPKLPVLCMDEQPVQLLKETRVPIPATRSMPSGSITNTNARHGRIFMFAEPLAGWREVAVREANQGRLGDRNGPAVGRRYADCAKVTLVCDNLNTHTKGAFYEAFAPERARA